jgi:hypothetical protein
MARVGAPWPIIGDLARVGREGEGKGERWAQLGSARGVVGCRREGGSARATPCCLPVHDCLLYVREESRKEEGEEKREKTKEGKEKKEKEKKWEIF